MDLAEKLEVAWSRVRKDQRTDFLIGDFEYHAFQRFRGRALKVLAERIESEHEYTPQPLRTIRVPKAFVTTRPASVPELDDRIFFQYLVDELAEEVEGDLSPLEDGILHSYRYAGDRQSAEMFRFGEASYSTFSRKTREIVDAHSHLVITDVATFYERIYHHELENTLRGLGGDAETVADLMTLLRKWRKGFSYGIPQGIWPSDYLGNLYLDPVDKFLARSGYSLCRYVDDIRVGVDSFEEGQRVLLLLEERLAPLGLALNSAKTNIVEDSEVDQVLFPYTERFKEIFRELREVLAEFLPEVDPYEEPDEEDIAELEHTVEVQSIRRLFREELQSARPNPHVLRFCLKKLRAFSDDGVLEDVLDSLGELLEATPRVVLYLTRIARDKPDHAEDIRRRLAAFVVDPEATAFDWQRMWLLQALERIGDLDNETIADIRRVLIDYRHKYHEAVAVQALLLVGSHGDEADRGWIQELYDAEHSPWIKRAILYAIRDLDKAKRNQFYRYCRGQDTMTDVILAYAISET